VLDCLQAAVLRSRTVLGVALRTSKVLLVAWRQIAIVAARREHIMLLPTLHRTVSVHSWLLMLIVVVLSAIVIDNDAFSLLLMVEVVI